MADERVVDMRAVTERFAKSTEAIDELAQRLQSLASSSELLTSADRSMKEAVVAIAGFVREASAMAGHLKGSADGLRTATSLAEKFLAQTDTNSIVMALDELRRSMMSQIAQLTEEREQASLAKTKVERELEETRIELSHLKARVSAIPEKQRRKLGL